MQKKLQRLLCLSLLLLSLMTKAEGTKEVSPSETNLTGLAQIPAIGSGSYFGCPADNRIYFDIKDFNTEKFYFGFRPHYYNTITGNGTKSPTTFCADSIYIRILNPSGVVVYTKKLDTTAGVAGFINTYAQGFAGPNIGGATPAGYNPLIFTPTVNGAYWIELYYSHDNGATSETNSSNNSWLKFPYFDLTVATTTNTKYLGRVHCNKWNLVAMSNVNALASGVTVTNRFSPDANASSESVFFSYSTDSVVTKVDFEPGFRPIAYNMAVNNYGVVNTGNWLVDRQSRNDASLPSLAGGYKIFLNDPDATLYPSGKVPSATLYPEPSLKGCPGGTIKLRYKLPENADVVILLDINGVAGYQAASTDRLIEQPNRLAGTNFYAWDGKDGLGIAMPNNSTLIFGVSTYFQKGKASIPLYDAEINKAGFKMVGVRPIATPALKMYWDDSQLTNVAACGATAGATLSTSNLTGAGINNATIGTAAPAHAWNGTGNASQTLPAANATYCASATVNDATTNVYQWDDYGNVRTINTWAYGIESFVSKTIMLQCVNVSGTIYNDADGSAGGAFTNILTGTEAGTNAGTLYAAIIDPDTREVVAFATVAANGTYTINGVAVNSTGLQVVITSTLPVVDGILPAETMPTGWLNTSPSLNTFNTGIVDVTGLNFGINRLPESAVSALNGLNNTPGSGDKTVPDALFLTSNVGSNANTQDYDGGTVSSIRITAFPNNVLSITLNGIKYGTCPTCTAWPDAGVTVPFTNGVGPTTPILIDPIDGPVSVIIPFVAIDNTGKEDATPGSVTLNYTTVLAVENLSFTASKISNKTIISFNTTKNATGSSFIIERSTTGTNYTEIGIINGTAFLSYSFTDVYPVSNEKNYYRIKEIDNAGKITYSTIKIVLYNTDGKIEIYPIPAYTEINVVLNDALQSKPLNVSIHNSQGVKVVSKKITKAKSTESFDIRALPSGVYNISLSNDANTIITKKIIVIK
jgi:Secretion system C-terminal sorting domain